MENLHRHIVYLLARRDCVIVPGVGAFIAERRPAAYNPTTGRWVPPTRHISFNAAVRSDDGLLSHSYSRAMGVDFEHARKEMELEVANMMQTISIVGRCRLGTLGTLSTNDEGRLYFSPAITPGRRSARLGYHAFSLDELPALTPTAEVDGDTPSGDAESLEAEHRSERHVPLMLRYGRQLAVACALLGIFIVAALLYNIPGPATQMASVVPVPSSKSVEVKKSEAVESRTAPGLHTASDLNTASDTEHDAPSAEPVKTSASAASSSSEKADPAPEALEARYHLIVATFVTDAEAEKFIAHSPIAETKSLYIVPGKRVTRVAIAGSDSRDELQKTLRSPEMRASHPNAWIWSAEKI